MVSQAFSPFAIQLRVKYADKHLDLFQTKMGLYKGAFKMLKVSEKLQNFVYLFNR